MQLAQRAEQQGEVPIGAVIIHQNQIVGEGWNQCISRNDPTAHAEIIAMRQAGEKLKNYRLCDTTLYVTLEPCAMCAGAMLHARIKRLVIGAPDPKTGATGSVLNVLQGNHAIHTVDVTQGVLHDACAEQLRAFFRHRRKQQKA